MRLDALIIYSPEHAFVVHPMVAADYVDFSLKGRKSTNNFYQILTTLSQLPYFHQREMKNFKLTVKENTNSK